MLSKQDIQKNVLTIINDIPEGVILEAAAKTRSAEEALAVLRPLRPADLRHGHRVLDPLAGGETALGGGPPPLHAPDAGS